MNIKNPKKLTVEERVAQIEQMLGISDWPDLRLTRGKSEDKIALIQRVVCIVCNVTLEALLSKEKTMRINDARKLGMYLCLEYRVGEALSYIARRFGRKDHGTVSHAHKTTGDMIDAKDEKLCEQNVRCRKLLDARINNHDPESLATWQPTNQTAD